MLKSKGRELCVLISAVAVATWLNFKSSPNNPPTQFQPSGQEMWLSKKARESTQGFSMAGLQPGLSFSDLSGSVQKQSLGRFSGKFDSNGFDIALDRNKRINRISQVQDRDAVHLELNGRRVTVDWSNLLNLPTEFAECKILESQPNLIKLGLANSNLTVKKGPFAEATFSLTLESAFPTAGVE